MPSRRPVLALAVVALLLCACDPIDAGGSSGSRGTGTVSGGSGSARGSHRVEYRTSQGGSASQRSVQVRSGSTARVTSRGSGTVSCRIAVDGRTLVQRSGSGSVTCSARVGG